MTVEEIYRRVRTVVLPGLTCFSISALVCKLYAGGYQIDVTRQPIYRGGAPQRPARLSLLRRTTWFPRRRRQRLVAARVGWDAPATYPSTSRPFIGPSSRDERRETAGRGRSAVA